MRGLSPSPSTRAAKWGSWWCPLVTEEEFCKFPPSLQHSDTPALIMSGALCLEMMHLRENKYSEVRSHFSGLCWSLQICPPNLDSPLKRIIPRIRPFLLPVKQQKRTTKSQPPNKLESTKTKHHCFYIMEPCSFIAWQNILLSRILIHSSLDK